MWGGEARDGLAATPMIRRVARSATFAALLLAGCDLGPDYQRPEIEMPVEFRATPATEEAAWPSADWWSGFRSQELNSLIEQARLQNFDIAAAVARVREADAQVRIAGAPLLPTVNASASASWQQVGAVKGFSGVTRGGSTTTTINVHSYAFTPLNAAYEIDFWGLNRAARQAAVSNAVFSRFDQEVVALTVVTNVASTWFTALGFADRLVVARANLADAEHTLAVIRGRLDAGTASALDVAQQEALVAGQRAVIPNLQNQLDQEIIGLGILVGRPPEAIDVRPGSLDALSLPPVGPGLPSSLLERRPDVAEAEAQLVAQNFNIKVARAAFFPAVTLTGSYGFANAALHTLFTPGGTLVSLAAGAAQPLFDGGTLRGQLEQAKGKYDEFLADYRKAVVQAFTDVENALTAWRYTTEQEALQRKAAATAQRAADIARAQMLAGTVDITTVLQAETTLYGDLDLLVQDRLARFLALLSLYKALGGGWVQPPGPIPDQFPGLTPGMVPGGIALPVGGNIR